MPKLLICTLIGDTLSQATNIIRRNQQRHTHVISTVMLHTWGKPFILTDCPTQDKCSKEAHVPFLSFVNLVTFVMCFLHGEHFPPLPCLMCYKQ